MRINKLDINRMTMNNTKKINSKKMNLYRSKSDKISIGIKK